MPAAMQKPTDQPPIPKTINNSSCRIKAKAAAMQQNGLIRQSQLLP
jgi:hypothetical protein